MRDERRRVERRGDGEEGGVGREGGSEGGEREERRGGEREERRR